MAVWGLQGGKTFNAPDSHALLNICRRDLISETDDELCDLLDRDDVLVRLLGRGLLAHGLSEGRRLGVGVWSCRR